MRLAMLDAGEGPPVALLHGLFGAAQNWGTIQKALAARHRVLALDLRSHGASPHDPAMDYPTMAADVAETLAAAGARPAAVVGHSMGGKVAMALALTDPAAVARLVVADIAPAPSGSGLLRYAQAMAALPLRPGLTRREADAHLADAVPEAGIRAFLLQNLRHDGVAPRWRLGLVQIAAAMPVLEGFDLPAGTAPWPGPALFVAGGRSDYLRPEHHPAIRALFPAAQFVTVPEAGHWVHAEKPAEFLAAIGPFLAAD